MKKEIIILSDLWGKNKSEWLVQFNETLSPEYKTKFYDSCELGEIDLTLSEEKLIHRQFVNFGIQKAVNKLLRIETQPQIYIGCSVGGVIAWKAGLLGLKMEQLITLSSTRLRMETEKPNCPITMYFGELDKHKPAAKWFESIGCNYKIIEQSNHDIYKDQLVVDQIVENINQSNG